MIIGHQKQLDFLKKSAEMGKVPHALLFCGQAQLGKKALAIEFAKILIGENFENHPDFTLLESDSSAKDIRISQIRDLIWKLSLYPYSAPYKVAVIDEAHRMNQDAQNCFLKTLEEPKGKSILILVTEHPEMLVSTVLSRVQKIRFFPVERKEIEKHIIKEGKTGDEAKYLSFLASGKPGLAIDFLKDEQKIKNQEKLISDIDKISESDFSFRFNYVKNISEQNPKEILNIWLNHFRDLFLKRLKGGSEAKYSLPKLKKIISLIQSTDYLISTTNVNPKLAFELLLMEL